MPRRPLMLAATPVHVLEAHDVVLAQISARLHFDDFQRQRARVFQAMLHADGNLSRLILGEQKSLSAARHLGRAAHHYPMLGAVVMHLQ